MQYLFLDESGNLHKNSTDRYFVIGGVYTDNYTDIKKSYVEINRELKEKNMEEKMDIVVKLQEMDGMYIVGIIVDKERLGIKIDQIHLYYNYVIRKLTDYLIQCRLIKKDKDQKLHINIDTTSMKKEEIDSLEMYLKTVYNIEKRYPFDINVTYWDSRKNYMVQVADIMANTLWNVAQLDNRAHIFRHLNKKRRLKITKLKMYN